MALTPTSVPSRRLNQLPWLGLHPSTHHYNEGDSYDNLNVEVISTNRRRDALADGVLIDAGPLAQDAGFRWPVALTAAAWQDCVAWSETDNAAQTHQDETGRLWDVLFMAAFAIRSAPEQCDRLQFKLYRVRRDGISREATLVTLNLIVGPGDAGKHVMTILLPQED